MKITNYTDLNKDSGEIKRVVRDIQSGLRQYNRSQYDDPMAGPIILAVHGDGRQVLAGLICDVAYGWLTVETLWVDSNHRRQGLGSRLLETSEKIGKARGCHGAHLTTYTFQNVDFYKRRGYESFGVLNDYPGQQSMVFLRKNL